MSGGAATSSLGVEVRADDHAAILSAVAKIALDNLKRGVRARTGQ
jgi:hypothetical protein